MTVPSCATSTADGGAAEIAIDDEYERWPELRAQLAAEAARLQPG